VDWVGPQGWSRWVRKILSPPGFDPVHSKSLHQLCYPGSHEIEIAQPQYINNDTAVFRFWTHKHYDCPW